MAQPSETNQGGNSVPGGRQRRSLPPKLIIQTGRFAWTQMWRVMMSNLAPRNKAGEYIRPESEFRNAISSAPDATYPPAAGRYKLYVGWGCPWAHRTLVVRALKGLEEAIAVSIVAPAPEEGGWVLEVPELGCRTLADLYQFGAPGYGGRCTVPILWDTKTKTIVNNESSDIIVMLNSEMNSFAKYPDVDLYPDELKGAIDEWNEKIYYTVNNGVYRCGFAQTQEAYENACISLFATLDEIEKVLANRQYVCGDRITLTDVRLFTTLLRFDVVYYGLFKCNRRRIKDYPYLWNYLKDLYYLSGVAETCNLEVVKREYYGNLFPLNPGGIIPVGPDMPI